MRLYGRRYRLELSKAGEYLVVEKLRVAFELTKSADSTPNQIRVRIWNLSRERIDQLLRGDFQSARLWAGYEELRLLFLADIIKIGVKREDMDWIVELECGDGDRDYHQSYVSQTLSAGTSSERLVGAALASMPNTSLGQLEPAAPATPATGAGTVRRDPRRALRPGRLAGRQLVYPGRPTADTAL